MTIVLEPDERQELLEIAARAIASGFEEADPWVPDLAQESPPLHQPAATFVTLEDTDGSLLGCIGTLEVRSPLAVDVAEHALAAAFDDPRLPALTTAQYATMRIEISVLSPLTALDVHSTETLAANLRPGIDGVLVEAGRRRATFLPAVWQKLPTTDEYLAHLWRKAGFRAGSWPDGLVAWKYETISFHDDSERQLTARN